MKVLKIGLLIAAVLSLTGWLCYSQDASQHYNEAIEYGMSGEFKEAKKEFEKILGHNLYSDVAKIWIERIREVSEGKIKTEGLTHLFRGANYYNKGMFNQSIVELKEATKIYPNDAHIHENLGTSYRELEMWDEAASEWRKAIGIDPNSIDSYVNLGLFYQRQGMLDQAMNEYRAALAIDSNNIDALVNLGTTYNSKGMLDEAKSLLEKVTVLNPDVASAHNNLAVIYYQEEQYELAIKHCDKAVELGTKIHPDFLELLKPYRK